ncbi:MAG: methyltransferase domain-containing protein [Anaerolineae bacterium]|nr:methyltransferase domain-containing protein [Anaerolineae bacterium]
MSDGASQADTTKARVQAQYGPAAEAYAVSQVHARGASLARLVELAEVSPDHTVLDVATAAGHTALAVAPLARRVVGVDLTPAMLAVASRLARERNLANVGFIEGDAERLPADDETFDRVMCRIALHHFPDPAQAVREMARVLKPGGRVAFVDNIVPPDPAAAAFVNRFETLRDPSHHWLFPLMELVAMFREAGLGVTHTETLDKVMDFYDWTERMSVPPSLEAELWVMLMTATGVTRDFLAPTEQDGRRTFTLHEGIVVAAKPG